MPKPLQVIYNMTEGNSLTAAELVWMMYLVENGGKALPVAAIEAT